MNKKFKVIIKKDPIFKYIVEDYPFYEGLFFHEKTNFIMKILKVHYLKRGLFLVDLGQTNLKFLFHFEKRLGTTFNDFTDFKFVRRFLQHFKMKNEIVYTMKHLSSLIMRLKSLHRDINFMTVKIRKMQTLKLKNHDIYKLLNRDPLTLEQMDLIHLD